MAIILGAALSAFAQFQYGDVSLNASGAVGIGYSAENGDDISGHGLNWGGQSTITGYYYAPGFASFSVVPYYNESRSNSTSSSVTDANGFDTSLNLFSGSAVPLSFSYGRASSSVNNFALGETNFTTRGTSDTFSASTNLKFGGMPPIMILYQQGDTAGDLYGTSQEVSTNFRAFMVNTAYVLDGFHLQGGYRSHWGSSEVPDIFSATTVGYDSASHSYSASVSHSIAWNGTASIGYNHDQYDESFTGGNNSGQFDDVTGVVLLHPTDRLQFASNVNFTDNLAGVLQQTIANVNGTTVLASDGERTNALTISNSASYNLSADLGLSGGYTYAQQSFAGELFTSQSLDGEVHYAKDVLGGRLNSTAGVTQTLDYDKQTGYRMLTGWGRRFGAWGVNGGFQYYRSQRTVLLEYTTSGYSYSAGLNHKLGMFQWNGSASASRSTYDQGGGGVNSSQSYAMNVSAKYGSIGGAYAKNTGNSILTVTGLVSTPLPPGALPFSTILFDGTSYSAAGSLIPHRGLELTGSWMKAKSSNLLLATTSASSSESSSQLNFRLTYIFRKLTFNAGYTRFQQSFSTSTTGAANFSTYYFGLQRWFNLL
jgi:hypothetical protein